MGGCRSAEPVDVTQVAQQLRAAQARVAVSTACTLDAALRAGLLAPAVVRP
jgi:hypothetical protein